ncbi:MAG: class A beta-lactamase [Caulobacter sp.]|nr:class A beta-lactamase [Caulobacter sp.]
MREPHRRFLITGAAALGLAGPALARSRDYLLLGARQMMALQQRSGGRLGIHAHNTRTGRVLSFRADERFNMSSTFKAVLAGAILARVDAGQESLDRLLPVTQADIVFHAPSTGPAVAKGSMSVGELCEAIIVTSDNPAANILMKTIGGPAALTHYARSLRDQSFRIDRWEPQLNDAGVGDERDTTRPFEMTGTLGKLLLGDALSPASRDLLTGWMTATKTGQNRLRKHLPAGWRGCDKTGWGSNGLTGDIGVFWTTDGAPIVISAYIAETNLPIEDREAVLADVGALAFELLGPAA